MNLLIIGATSALAEAISQHYLDKDNHLILAARNQQRLASLSQDLSIKGQAQISTLSFDAEDLDSHTTLFNNAVNLCNQIDLILIAHGSLPNQHDCELDASLTQQTLIVNATSVINLATLTANQLQHQGHGTLAVISSVAGDRGRRSNYVYGCAKAMISTFFDGLTQRFLGTDINICNIKPGPFTSPMTNHLTPGLLWSTPQKIAPSIVKSITKGKAVIYTPGYWRVIMWLIKKLPARIAQNL